MSENKPKKVSKKSLAYVRPQPVGFTLESMPGVEFRFKKPSVDDEAWCQATFGKNPYEMIKQRSAMLSDLCRLYFHYLDNESKLRFKARTVKVVDEETLEEREETLSGPKALMHAITGGHTEVLLIVNAFAQTLFAFRGESEFSDEEKKRLKEVYAAVAGQAPPAPAEPTA